MAAVQTINAEIHIRRGDYDELRKVYDPANPDPNLSREHPFQVMPGELAIAQDTSTLFFRLDDGQDPDYTKANTTQRLIEMPFQANDLKVSDRNAVTAGWRKLGTHSGSMFCAILTVVAGDGLWRCFVHRSGNAASVMSLDADPNAKISALKYVDTADGGEIWANVAADCTMYAEVVDETTNRSGTSSGWSFDPDFAASQTEPTGVGVNATGLPAQSDTSACHAVLQKADGALAASENEPFEAHGLIDDFDDAVLPGVYKAMDASNGPSGRGRGSVMVTRSKLVSGHSMIADKLIQLYMVGGVTVSGVDAESELWIRDGYANAGAYTWSGWQRIDCDRERLIPDGVFYVTTAAEFTAALEAPAPTEDTVKVVWVLNSITIEAASGYSVAMTSPVAVYGEQINWHVSSFYNTGASLKTIRFFNRYNNFNYGISTGSLQVAKVRLLFKRVLFVAQVASGSFLNGGNALYEIDYRQLVLEDGGSPVWTAYPPPPEWSQAMWDNTASAGTAPAQESFPMSIANYVATTAELTGQLWCSRFVSSASCTCRELGFFPIGGSLGSIILGIYDATTDALLAQTSAFTPSGTKKILWQTTTQSFTLEAGHEYYFALAASGNQLNVEALAWKQDPIIDSACVQNKYLGPSISSLPDPKNISAYAGGHQIQCWMACK